MNTAQPTAREPLVLLTLAVLGAHVLLLRAAPRFEPPKPPGMRALVTRTIETPVQEAAVAAVAAVATNPVFTAISEEKMPVARAARSKFATNLVAKEDPDPVVEARTAPVSQAPAARVEAVVAAAAPATAARESSPQVVAFVVAPPARLRYTVSGHARGINWQAEGELQWRHDGHSYEALLAYTVPLLGSRSQRSTGRITPEGLAPTRFADKSRSEQAAHFERDKGKVSFSSNAPDALLAAGAQDRLSVLLQLGAMIAADPQKFPAGATIELQTVGTRDAEPWLFTMEADELLQLPGGSVHSSKLIRVPRREFDVKVELWLATAMDYLPVRVRLTQANGDYVDQQWSSTDRP